MKNKVAEWLRDSKITAVQADVLNNVDFKNHPEYYDVIVTSPYGLAAIQQDAFYFEPICSSFKELKYDFWHDFLFTKETLATVLSHQNGVALLLAIKNDNRAAKNLLESNPHPQALREAMDTLQASLEATTSRPNF